MDAHQAKHRFDKAFPGCSNWEHHETSKYQKVSKKVSKKVSQSSDPHGEQIG